MFRSYPRITFILAACAVLLSSRGVFAQTYVCVDTNVGSFCMVMLDTDAPGTVENFLNYVEDGDYDNTFIHRSIPQYAIQGGGYSIDPLGQPIPQDPPIDNEFKVSNTRGTVAMAKFANEPNSASNEWFVNLTDNSATLDYSNEGYTVFAKVVNGMSVVDAIGDSLRVDLTASLGDEFGEVPVRQKRDTGVELDDLVIVNKVYVATDVTVDPPEGTDTGPTDEEQALYACTTDWVESLAPSRVCMETSVGQFCMDLHPDVAPNTVANFLHYVADGDYDNSLIHRSVADFIVQGGGFLATPFGKEVPQDPSITNEFNMSNTRGTVAMAKIAGDPDSATSQWFVNLADNSSSLNSENEGYTVFATIPSEDMAVVDSIGALNTFDITNANSAFGAVPLVTSDGGASGRLVVVKRAYIPGAGDNPCLPNLQALTEFSGASFTLPVRVGTKLYKLTFRLQSLPPEYVFTLDFTNIIGLTDKPCQT